MILQGLSIIGSAYLSDSSFDTSPCYLHVLLPNEKSPFALWFSRFDEQGNFRLVDHYDLVVNSSPAGTYYPSLAVTSHSSHETDSTLYVEGNIKNTGTKTIAFFRTFATFYDQNGEVVAVAIERGYSSSPISESLGFGQVKPRLLLFRLMDLMRAVGLRRFLTMQ
jgi:hypothetical protein